MPVDGPHPIVFSHAGICVSFYCNLHCEHCYVPKGIKTSTSGFWSLHNYLSRR